MHEKELIKLIKKGESERVEFKESMSDWKEIIKTISAFSNTKGGIVLIGITDGGKTKGLQIGRKTLEDLANKIKENTDPKNYPKIRMEEINKKRIIAIEMEESRSKPVFAFDRVYKRVGKTNQKVSSEEIRKLAKESENIYWDGQICREAAFKDVDEEKVERFLRKAKYERNFNIDPETPIKEALERLELMRDEKLTNAAILLFGKKPQKFFLQAETRCARFKGLEPVKPFLDMKVFGGDIIDQVDKSLSFVLEHIPMKVYLAGKPEREERYEYPPDAIREAIINAVCHRDYEISSNVQIRIFDDRIEIWGCGFLPKPLTPESLKGKHRSILRNPLVAKHFFLIKFIEQWGTGTNDIIDMCLNWGLPEPLFEYVTGDFVVTFRKSKLTEDFLEKIGLNKRQREAIEYLKEHRKITSRKYAALFKITERMARNDLGELAVKKVIERKGISDKTTYYVLAEI